MRFAAKLGLKPKEFWEMSPGEFRCYGTYSRYRDAWLVRRMGQWSDPPTEEALLGLPEVSGFDEMTEEERDLALKRELGAILG